MTGRRIDPPMHMRWIRACGLLLALPLILAGIGPGAITPLHGLARGYVILGLADAR